MALNAALLKQEIKAAYLEEQNEQSDANASADRIAEKIANAVVTQIQALTITYTSGLVAPSGPVTGFFTYTLS